VSPLLTVKSSVNIMSPRHAALPAVAFDGWFHLMSDPAPV
jgi:hypothetical protein